MQQPGTVAGGLGLHEDGKLSIPVYDTNRALPAPHAVRERLRRELDGHERGLPLP